MINWKKFHKKIPASVKMGKNTYEVLWCAEFPNSKEQLGESRFNDSKQIIISLNQPIKEAVHTYWHELLHILSYEFDANLTENQVLKLEKGLKDLLKKDNIFKGVKSETKANKRKRSNTTRVRKTCSKIR